MISDVNYSYYPYNYLTNVDVVVKYRFRIRFPFKTFPISRNVPANRNPEKSLFAIDLLLIFSNLLTVRNWKQNGGHFLRRLNILWRNNYRLCWWVALEIKVVTNGLVKKKIIIISYAVRQQGIFIFIFFAIRISRPWFDPDIHIFFVFKTVLRYNLNVFKRCLNFKCLEKEI